jgi:DNA replication protein DnaC
MSESWLTINGLSNDNFWDARYHGAFFKLKDGALPSSALKSFFQGLTFPDCGNVIQAVIYLYILNKYGEAVFNTVFGFPNVQLLITQILFREFTSNNKENPVGNPLFFIFDTIVNVAKQGDLSQLEHGDIVYIKGVEQYESKHISGFFPGFNIIAVKPNPSDELKFIGFDPDLFNKGPITFEELRKILVDAYNEEQSEEARKFIAIHKERAETDGDRLNKIKADMADMLKDDKIDEDSPIIGLQRAIRLNTDKLDEFIGRMMKKNAWYETELPEDFEYRVSKIPPRYVTPIPSENTDSTFDNYRVTSDTHQSLLDIFKRFSHAVYTKPDEPLVLIVSGSVGIGKTHLSISLTKFMGEHGKKVLFVDENYISNYYQSNNAKYPWRTLGFSRWVDNCDLIIYDDINSIYGSGATFLEEAYSYIFTRKKALLVTSNIHLNVFNEYIPYYMSFESPYVKNTLVINDIKLESFRKTWRLSDDDTLIQQLYEYEGKNTAGIILQKIDLAECITKYKESGGVEDTIYIVKEPYRYQRVFDLYIGQDNNIEKHNLYIMNVSEKNEYIEQFINLVQKYYNNKKKIIIITQMTLDNLVHRLINVLNGYLLINRKPKILDRVKVIFPQLAPILEKNMEDLHP